MTIVGQQHGKQSGKQMTHYEDKFWDKEEYVSLMFHAETNYPEYNFINNSWSTDTTPAE